jgi:hypothetical protein
MLDFRRSLIPLLSRPLFDILFPAATALMIAADCLFWLHAPQHQPMGYLPLLCLATALLLSLSQLYISPPSKSFNKSGERFLQDFGSYAIVTFILTLLGMTQSHLIGADYRSTSLLSIAALAFTSMRTSRSPLHYCIVLALLLVGQLQYTWGNKNISLFLAIAGLYPLIARRSPKEQSALITAASIILGYLTLNVSFAFSAFVAAIMVRASPITIMIRFITCIIIYLVETPLFDGTTPSPERLLHVVTHERFVVWQESLSCWLSSPLFGAPICIQDLYGGVYAHFHNTALTALAFNGPIGFLFTLWAAWRIWIFGRSVQLREFTGLFLAWSLLDEPMFFFSVGILFVLTLLHHSQEQSGEFAKNA